MNYFDCPIRIRYAETDRMGVSYYANYLVWFEAARSDYFRELGLPYAKLEEQNIILPVAEAHCQYYQPTTYDELIYVRVAVSYLKMTSMKFTYQVLDESKTKLIAWGYTVHVFVEKNGKPMKVPANVRSCVTQFDLHEKQITSD